MEDELDFYIRSLCACAFIGILLFGFYKMAQRYKKLVYRGDLKLVDRLALTKTVSMVVVNYKQVNYMLSVSEKGAMLLQKHSEPRSEESRETV